MTSPFRKSPRKSKYNNRRVYLDGYSFASQAEADYYAQLVLLQKAGRISELSIHPKFPVEIEGKRVCIYEADFSYRDSATDMLVVADVKGARTAVYNLKKKLVEASYGFTITEIPAKSVRTTRAA